MYVTYFDESVQGLQVDSAVKYRGVDIGSVEKMRVAPDNRLIGVVMKLDLPDVEGKVVSQLKAAGITGMLFVELNQRMPDELDLSPRVDFAAEYPIIPSRPSQLKQILSAVDMVVDKTKQVDIIGISNQVKDSMKSVETFLRPSHRKIARCTSQLHLEFIHISCYYSPVFEIAISSQVSFNSQKIENSSATRRQHFILSAHNSKHETQNSLFGHAYERIL